ncbi:hypothetical protein Dimus_023708 [Dionaea muscipula]
MAATIEGEERVIAAAHKILKSLRTSRDETNDMVSILSSFDNRLSSITDLIDSPKSGATSGIITSSVSDVPISEVSRFECAEKLILCRDSDPSSLWEDSPDESSEYLAAIDEVLQLMEGLSFQRQGDVMDRAESAVQVAMSRLEEEFRRVLVRNTVPLDAERLHGSIRRVFLSFAGSDGDMVDEFGNFGEEDGGDGSGNHCYHERGVSVGVDTSIDLINHDVIADLRDIAERMIRAGYEKECSQVYCNVRRDVLLDCLGILGVEKLSIEEVHKIEWKSLDDKMKKWVQAVKLMVKALLRAEKRLCDQIFDGSELINVVYVETSKACVMQMLNFGEAVAIGRRSPEKLFRILDMYDALADTLPDLRDLFSNDDESGERVYREAGGVLNALGEAAKGTFKEFEKAVKGETSRRPIHGGEIHPLTRYVMNYVKLLVDYSDSLNSLLQPDAVEGDVEVNGDDLREMSPVGRHMTLLLYSLESNLEDKAGLYEDIALQFIFLMNNKLYIVQKVKDSELGKLLGDDWVRRRRGLIRKYATNYLRTSWTKVLSCLKDEGIGGISTAASKIALKEKFKNFNAGFEDIYRIQTAWKVPDPQLRAELRISISEKVIPAYRAFLGRFGSHLESGKHSGKYIKYTAEDLEAYLADLFEGTPAILHHMRRRNA